MFEEIGKLQLFYKSSTDSSSRVMSGNSHLSVLVLEGKVFQNQSWLVRGAHPEHSLSVVVHFSKH